MLPMQAVQLVNRVAFKRKIGPHMRVEPACHIILGQAKIIAIKRRGQSRTQDIEKLGVTRLCRKTVKLYILLSIRHEHFPIAASEREILKVLLDDVDQRSVLPIKAFAVTRDDHLQTRWNETEHDGIVSY